MFKQKRLGNKGTGTPRSEQTSQASDEMDEQDDQIAHHRIVAGRGIPRNYGRNNNSPASGLKLPSVRLGRSSKQCTSMMTPSLLARNRLRLVGLIAFVHQVSLAP